MSELGKRLSVAGIGIPGVLGLAFFGGVGRDLGVSTQDRAVDAFLGLVAGKKADGQKNEIAHHQNSPLRPNWK